VCSNFEIKRNYKDMELHVVVVSSMHLPKKDVWGSCDAYCVVKLANANFKTHVLKNTLNPHWEESGNFSLKWVSSLPLFHLVVLLSAF
jgi:Ca2+-dependent lipid-binding protein